MKRSNLVLKTGLAALLASSIGTVSAETVDGTADAEVVAPLTLTESASLDFGQVAGGTVAGTVEVDSAGVRTAGGGASVVSASVFAPATFDITGALSTAITVTMNTAGAQLDDGGTGAIMTLSGFTTTALPVTTDGAGDATFDVGAVLNVNASQEAGFYDTTAGSGSPYSVTVNYN